MSTKMNSSYVMVLPNEILEQIMFYVYENADKHKKNDIFECMHVCKSWKNIAQIIGYSSITLQNRRKWWKLLAAVTNESGTPASFVKSLIYKFPTTTSELEVISNRFMYIEHLNTAKPDNDFYASLRDLHSVEGKFSRLKSFTPGYEQSNFRSYALCAQQFHKTLTKLRFAGFNLINSPHNTYSRIDFKSFPHLTELLIDDAVILFDRTTTPMPIYWFNSIIDDCICVQSLDFRSRYIGSTNSEEPIDLSVIKPKSSVKKLTVKMEVTNDNGALSYIKHKFIRLEQFHLINNCREKWNANSRLLPGVELEKLLTYASNIPIYNIQFVYVNQEGLDMAFNYCKALSSSKSTREEIQISFSSEFDNWSSLPTACLDIKKPSALLLQIEIIFNSGRCFPEGNDGIMLSTFSKFFAKNGDHAHHLSINFKTDRFVTNDSILRSNAHLFLQSIFKNCGNMKSLCVKNKGWIENRGDLRLTSSIASTLNYLEFNNCKIDRKLLTSLSPKIPKLDTLKLKYCLLPYWNESCGCQIKRVHMRNTAISLLYLENIVHYTDYIDRSSTVVTVEIRKTIPKVNVIHLSINLKEDNNNQQQRIPKQTVTQSHCCFLPNKRRRNPKYSIQCRSINKVIITERFGKAEVNCGGLL